MNTRLKGTKVETGVPIVHCFLQFAGQGTDVQLVVSHFAVLGLEEQKWIVGHYVMNRKRFKN